MHELRPRLVQTQCWCPRDLDSSVSCDNGVILINRIQTVQTSLRPCTLPPRLSPDLISNKAVGRRGSVLDWNLFARPAALSRFTVFAVQVDLAVYNTQQY